MTSIPHSISDFMHTHDAIRKFQVLLKHINLHVGEYKWSARDQDFYGWMKCDGRSLDRTVYKNLFTVIGDTFGAVDENHFNLPDLRGRVFGGIGQGDALTNRPLGNSVGTETHTLTSAEMPSHTHTGTTDLDGSHTHTTNADGGTVGLAKIDGEGTAGTIDTTAGEINNKDVVALTIAPSGAHTHTFTTNPTGGGSAHNNMQPTLFAGNVFIFTGIMA